MYYATPEGVAAYMLQMGLKLAYYALLPILPSRLLTSGSRALPTRKA